MTPKKIKDFRFKLVRELRESLPNSSQIAIGKLANRLERLMVEQAFSLVEVDHDKDCACWHCVGALHQDVMRHQCEMKVTREMAEEYD